jgi:UDP-N-acetylglucosamine/UDP-N-acetylgalactosamine diphosphorylase
MTENTPSEKQRFESAGQAQVFRFWEDLDQGGKDQLCSDAREIDLEEIDRLVKTLVKSDGGEKLDLEGLEPAPYVLHPQNGGEPSPWREAVELGEAALRAGKVAAFTVAGGQGTRLGYDGPKGTFPVGPVSGKTLFQIFAEKLLAAGDRYGVEIPWFIMTSAINHEATVEAFEEGGYFGLSKDQVMFFSQGRMPAVDPEGKILLAEKDAIAMSPDGHGGSLRALVRSGAVARMKEQGIEAISYFQVDNPLVRVIDPAFIGFHLKAGSDMSSKMIPKAYAGEKVGHFCVQNGRTVVVEYSDMPAEMQEQRDEQGELRFIAGSIAIHVLAVDFVERVGGGESGAALPFHRADKKIKTLDASGNRVSPDQPNGVKFEMFVFDALPFANNPVIIETLREDDFSPVKNAEGVDSPETCRNDQVRQWTRWLKAVGVELSTDESGLPEITFEVSPLFADSEAVFVEKWQALEEKPLIEDGTLLA